MSEMFLRVAPDAPPVPVVDHLSAEEASMSLAGAREVCAWMAA